MRKVLLFSAMALSALFAATATAMAATSFDRVGVFAQASADGQPAHQHHIAVNQASGDVYVTDPVNDRIAVYRPNGTGADLLTTFGTGVVTDPFGIAIDQATGDVYVSDATGIVMYTNDGAPTPTFTQDGTFISPVVTGPLAFDAVNDQLLVADRLSNTIHRYSTTGAAGAGFDGSAGAGSPGAFTGLQDLAVDSTGDVVVVDSTGDPALGTGTSRVERFGSTGAWEATLGPVDGAATVAVRPSDDDVVVSGNQDAVNELAVTVPTLQGFTSDGRKTAALALDASTQYSLVSGMAGAAGAQGALYVATDVDAAYGGAFGIPSIQIYSAAPISAPALANIKATPSESDVAIKANIDTSRADTTYRVEYGTTTGYGTTLPASGSAALSGSATSTPVVRQAFGLSASTTYHYRFVATNVAGTTVTADRTFTTTSGQVSTPVADSCPNATVRGRQQSGYLPDCRAYEQVTPTDKGGSGIVGWFAKGSPFAGQTVLSAIAPDGDSAAYWSYQAFGDSKSALLNSYKASRTSTGWTSAAVSPAVSANNEHPEYAGSLHMGASGATPDLSKFFIESRQRFGDGNERPVGGFYNGVLNHNDVYATTPGGPVDWLSRPAGNGPATSNYIARYMGSSQNGDKVFFTSSEPLVPEAAGDVGGDTLYERSGGQTKLVGVDSDGAPQSLCGSVLGTYNVHGDDTALPGLRWARSSTAGAISADGSRVYFGAPDPDGAGSGDPACDEPTQLYLRSGGLTVNASRSRRSSPDPNGTRYARFLGASEDGSKMLFSSAEALTDAAVSVPGAGAQNIYIYDADGGTLTLVTPEPVRLLGAVISRDGSRVYYINDSPDFRVSTYGADGLRTVATLETPPVIAGSGDPAGSAFGGSDPAIRVSPDGNRFLFPANEDLTGTGAHDAAQFYLYDAIASDLVCVSCAPGGGAPWPDGPALRQSSDQSTQPSWPAIRNLSDDGTRVFFDSSDALVARDDNGHNDVYEWHDGRVSLISDGHDPIGSFFFGASEDGRDVFFATAGDVIAADRDHGDIDIYDARIDGGFVESDEPKPCRDDGCQGPTAATTAAGAPGSMSTVGAGDRSPGRSAKASLTVSKVKVTTGSTATLKVKANGAGRIVVSGMSIRPSSKIINKMGVASVTVRLTDKARRQLAKKRTLKLSVKVAFTPKAGTATAKKVTLTFKEPRRGKRTAVPPTHHLAATAGR